MKRLALLALLLLSAFGAAAAEARDYRAEIRRTTGGVPHIKASGYGDLGFGHGYAFAQDNLCTLADSILTVNAERSRYLGAEANYGERGEINNLKSDFFYQRIKDMKTVERLVRQKPPQGPRSEVRAAVRGFAAGYNAYLRRTGVKRLPDPRCRGAKWVRPITAMDLYRRYYQLTLRASSVNFLTAIVDAGPPAVALRRPDAGQMRDSMERDPVLGHDASGLGSNAYGLGRKVTAHGEGIVLGNPHFPWHGSERFYEAHLTIPGKLDVAGASLFGAPVVNIGFTDGVAWSHTVSAARRFTPYELKLAEGDPLSYVIDGKTEKMTMRTVRVRAADGTTPTHTFYETRWGPILSSPSNGFVWTFQNAYAMADANAENLRILNAWALMNRAQSVRELKRAQDRSQGIPWVYTTAADERGESYFADHSVVPHVTRAKVEQCVTSDFGKLVLAQANLPVLDGSRSECRWGRDSDSYGAGTFGPKNLPMQFRSDYVANANEFWIANPRKPLEGFPQIFGAERTPRSLRTRLAFQMIEERIARKDKIALSEVMKTMYNNRVLSAELGRDAVVAECRENPQQSLPDGPTVDVSEACEVLAAWDMRANLNSRGEILWFEFWDRFSAAVPAGDRYTVPFDPADPIGTPHTINRDHPGLMAALADAVQDMRDAGSPLNAATGERQAEPKGGELIPIHGCQAAIGCFNVIEPFRLAPGDLRDIRTGSSFIMAATFAGRGPVARTILTYSQSENRRSPHFADQTKLYSQKKWLPMRFRERSIERDPKFSRRVVRGSD